jgi:hypothetical protein
MAQINLSSRPNAFKVLGYAKQLCKLLDMDFAPILEEMTSGDYDHLIAVFKENFSGYIEIT